jgi:hypothetical protein
MALTTDRQQEIVDALLEYERVDAAYRVESLTSEDIRVYLTDPSWYDSTGTTDDGRSEHDVWLETAPAAEIADWVDLDDLMTTQCVYCDAEVERATEPTAPAADDDAAWAELAALHADGCEWVETRAHRWTRSLSPGEAAGILGVSRRTILNYRDAGLLSGSHETPGGHLRIPEATVQRLRLGHLPIMRAHERQIVAGAGRTEVWLSALGNGTARDESDRLYWTTDDWAVPQR